MRPPSAGFLYLALTAVGAVVFFVYLTRPFFFEHPANSAPADLGEARYLLKLARGTQGAQRDRFLATALRLAKAHDDEALVGEIARATAGDATSPFVEIQPGIALADFGENGRTEGAAMGSVRLTNPTDVPLRALLEFRSHGGDLGLFVVDGQVSRFPFTGDEQPKRGSFLTPAVAPGQEIVIRVGVSGAGEPAGGLEFVGAEIRR